MSVGRALGTTFTLTSLLISLSLVGCNKGETDDSAAPPAGGGQYPGMGRAPGGGGAPGGGAPGAATGGSPGEIAFNSNRCSGCHGAIGGGRKGRAPDLSHAGSDAKHTADWFMKYIKNPQSVDPGSRMPPQSKVSDTDLKTLGTYLASLK